MGRWLSERGMWKGDGLTTDEIALRTDLEQALVRFAVA